MTTASEQLIADIHPALATDAEAVAVIALAPLVDVFLAIDDATLTIALDDSAAPQVLTLGDHTIAGLVAALPAGLGASLLDSTWAAVSAQALAPVSTLALAASSAAQLSAYTAGLWRALRPVAFGLAELRSVVDALIAQADIRRASGSWLDLWGLVWRIPRLPAETDSAYRARVIYTLTLPRVNNSALEALIARAFGYTARVEDGGVGGLFTPNANGATWGPGGSGVWGPPSYGQFQVTISADSGVDTNTLIALIRQYKASGTSFTLATAYTPAGVVAFGDIAGTWE